MEDIVEINFYEIEENESYIKVVKKVLTKCFEKENLENTNMYISITLTNPEIIRKINNQYRNIDKQTDVLSFPMFEKNEIQEKIKNKENIVKEVLGDIIISIQQVEKQAKEYGHSLERELAYMLVHGFYHLMGYDHIEQKDKEIMRPKEEKILQELNIKRL